MDKLNKSIVKIITYVRNPSFLEPWKVEMFGVSNATGFCILHEGIKYILTNEHVVQYNETVQIYSHILGGIFHGKVIKRVSKFDLALLEIKDKKLYNFLQPIKQAKSFSKGDKVFIMGYPIGGDTPAITSGMFNRVHYSSYGQSTQGISFQTSSLINPGSSGSPLLNKNFEYFGVAYSGEHGRKQVIIEFCIPLIFIKIFLNLKVDRNLSNTYVHFQPVTNKFIRVFYNLPENVNQGILIIKGDDRLKKGDILTYFNGYKVFANGLILLDDIINTWDIKSDTGDVMDLKYYISLLPPDEYPITIIRDGKIIKEKLKIYTPDYIFAGDVPENYWKYCIILGFVFVPFNFEVIHHKTLRNSMAFNLARKYYLKENKDENIGKRKVLCSKLIGLNEYVQDDFFVGEIVSKVNGKKIKNFEDFVETIKSQKDKIYITFEKFDYQLLVNKEMMDNNQKIINECIYEGLPWYQI